MDGVRIAKREVDRLQTTGSEYFVWDRDLTGFGVRVRESGAKSYVIKYRAGSGRSAPTRRLTIGTIGKLTPEEARRIAKAKLVEVAAGGDPAADRAKQRSDLTISQLLDLYFEEGVEHKKASTLATDRSRANRHIRPLLGGKRVNDITSVDVDKMKRDIKAGKTARDVKTGFKGRSIVRGGEGVASKTVILLSAIYGFAIERKICTINPAQGVKKYKGQAKERFLSTEELERLGTAIRTGETEGFAWSPSQGPKAKHRAHDENAKSKISPHAAAALRLLILTGARLSEILHLEWPHIDFERGLLLLPDSKTGKKAIILNAPALTILADIPRLGRYVIAGESAGQSDEKPRSDLKRPWRQVCAAAGLEKVRLHDLRHTFASIGAGGGLGLPIVGKLLGHMQASTTMRYAHLDNDPLRRASNRIGKQIVVAMGDVSPMASAEKVVPLRREG